MVYHHFWSVPVSRLFQDSWFPHLPQWQCGAFVLTTLSFELLLCVIYHLKPKCQSCQPTYSLCLLETLLGCQVVAFRRGRCRKLLDGYKVPYKRSYVGAAVLSNGYGSIYWRRSHQNSTVLFSVPRGKRILSQRLASGQDGADRTNWMPCFVCTVQRCLVAAGYRSSHLDRCTKLIPDHRHCRRRMVAHRHQNWNHQQQSLVVVAGVSILWVCPSFSRKQMEFTGTLTRLVETDLGLIIEIHMRPFADG